jgi:hypothetical protein
MCDSGLVLDGTAEACVHHCINKDKTNLYISREGIISIYHTCSIPYYTT